MASIRQKTDSAGLTYYEIGVSRGRGKSKVYRNWRPEAGWSAKTTKRELTRFTADLEREVEDGETVSRNERKAAEERQRREAAKIQTVKQYGEQVFMPSLSVRCSENTRDSYQRNLEKHIYPSIGEMKLPEVTSADLSAMLLSFQANGKAIASVVKLYTILQGLFKMAYMSDIISCNPMDKVQRPRQRKDEVKKDGVAAYTVEEIKHILQCIEKEPLKWRVYVHLLIDTGIRRGEGCGLQWHCVDFKNNSITISGNLCYTVSKGIYLDTPKSGKTRMVDVSPEVMALLRQLRAEQAETAISKYVFTQDGTAEAMHPQSPMRYFQKFGEKYGIADFHPHKLRHSFASIAITSGADVASVSEILGHSDKAVTLRIYSHADEESKKRASQTFRDALKKA